MIYRIYNFLHMLPFFRINKSSRKRIPFSKISERLKGSIAENIDEIGRKVLIPNTFKVYFNKLDRAQRINVEDILVQELEEELNSISMEWVTTDYDGGFAVEISEDESLSRGEFYVECSLDRNNCKTNKYYDNRNNISQTLIEDCDESNNDTCMSVNRKFLPLISEEAIETIREVNSEDKYSKVYIAKVTFLDNEKYIELKKGNNTIGRSERCDICLGCKDNTVSRRHIELDVDDDMIMMKSLGINGTYLNGERIGVGRENEIFVQDIIRIGGYKIEIKLVVFSK